MYLAEHYLKIYLLEFERNEYFLKVFIFQWLENCIDKIMKIPGDLTFLPENRPNHVLVNEYLPGQGILV